MAEEEASSPKAKNDEAESSLLAEADFPDYIRSCSKFGIINKRGDFRAVNLLSVITLLALSSASLEIRTSHPYPGLWQREDVQAGLKDWGCCFT